MPLFALRRSDSLSLRENLSRLWVLEALVVEQCTQNASDEDIGNLEQYAAELKTEYLAGDFGSIEQLNCLVERVFDLETLACLLEGGAILDLNLDCRGVRHSDLLSENE